jgi:hypothetical protein
MATSFLGRRVPAETLRIRKQPLRLPLLLLLFWWLLKLLVRLVLRVAGSPVAVATLTVLTLTWAVCRLTNPLLVVAGFLLMAGILVAIRFRWRASLSAASGCLCGRGGGAGRSTAISGPPPWTLRS